MQQDAAPSRAPAVRPEAVRSQAPAAMKLKAITADSLQAELDRIAALRDQGRNAEADKALEEFRRVHPDYRIPDAMWERVKPR